MTTTYTIKLRCAVESEPNRHRGSHWPQTKRKQAQKEHVTLLLESWLSAMRSHHHQFAPGIPKRVHLVRFHVLGVGLDSDNLPCAFKKIRDSVAEWFHVDDGPKGPITWKYSQCKVAQGERWTGKMLLIF